MRTHALALLIGTGVVVGTYLSTSSGGSQPFRPEPTSAKATKATQATQTAEAARPAYGHLIVQLEGTIHGLNATWITPKTSGYNETKLQSSFAIDLFDGAGARLGTYPVDLSRFDTDPVRVGKSLRVQGCEVLDSKIVTMVNVPYFAATAIMQVRNGGIVIGRLGAAQLAKLIEQGEVR